MKELNLVRVWELCNILSNKQSELSELEDKYVYLLGSTSEYIEMSFKSFLEYYSFKVETYSIIVFNTDKMPYEDYSNNDVSYIPSFLLSFGAKELNQWIENEIENQLRQQEKDKLHKKENLKLEIERLNKQLNNL